MHRIMFLFPLIAIAGCATLDRGAKTVCARKAEIIGAAQAVIDTLNQQCPIIDAPAVTSEG